MSIRREDKKLKEEIVKDILKNYLWLKEKKIKIFRLKKPANY